MSPPNDSEPPKTLRRMASEKLSSDNPSQLGDPASLKAEAADSEPTDQDRGAANDPEAKKRGEETRKELERKEKENMNRGQKAGQKMSHGSKL
ncbi:hypothetical protein H2201_002627 [Coniosporium apollinis]|uniref:Small EDRK-rich factor-like N-terminal domain-containing protein n=2 Tax=Coniosporium TaxID=2810619 RepID=A0ABQ9NYR4_9PEZI|nr:hypothetical protein H2199_007134 [Cladosporium sp. JES 115]KAJ9667108.1 hypothetical protein H2201_002627 [Coniosporium apollinis]